MKNSKPGWLINLTGAVLFVLVMVSSFLHPRFLFAQTESASVSGQVTDPSGAVIPEAAVRIRNVDTSVSLTTATNSVGFYAFPSLKPGHYLMTVSKPMFRTVSVTGIVLNVQQNLSRNFSLQVGSSAVSITVSADSLNVNTLDASVSTVVDRHFIENMPLNGRSFQTLIMLTPGVVVTPVSVTSYQGQFSVNGQRSDSNYFAVDGVAANLGTDQVGNALPGALGGNAPGYNVLGTTSSMVSIDAMQEFRINTSSFAPEFGRMPGAQVSIVTRSGTNNWHGTLFDYLRNSIFDANDWFANKGGLPKAQTRQNDFGGVIGGPIIKNRTFFFFSYEGLRLRQPQAGQGATPDLASRQAASAAIQPFLNAFPLPNGPELGGGMARLYTSYTNPGSSDAYSIRVDHMVNSRLNLFARYNYSPSTVAPRFVAAPNSVIQTSTNNHTFTLGLNQVVTSSMSNEIRMNYSNSKSTGAALLDNYGGAVPLSSGAIPFPSGITLANGEFSFQILGTTNAAYFDGSSGTSEQRQVNIVDNLSYIKGSHQMKFGLDYRWLSPFSDTTPYIQEALFNGMSGVLSGVPLGVYLISYRQAVALAHEYSFYGQDTWKVTPRLTLTYGLRWDINPAPTGKNPSSVPFAVQGLNDPTTMTVAPRGTPLYDTTYGNIAPRVGVAYQLRRQNGRETVLRGGWGLFYDLASGSLGNYTIRWPFGAFTNLGGVPYPITPQQAVAPVLSTALPIKNAGLSLADPNLKLPRIYQWNFAVEQALGGNQSLSLTYVAALGRDLLRNDTLYSPNANFPGSYLSITRNTATSDYHAFQVKFQRHLSHGLQALASYSLSHSIDNASNDWASFTPGVVANPNIDRGNSEFDIRHSVSGALTYDIPAPWKGRFVRDILGGWSVDTLFIARSALPVNLVGGSVIMNGTSFNFRPDVVSNVPFYFYGAQYPGGKALNASAFARPAAGMQGNLGRDVLRGFGAWQDDFSLRRQFRLTEKASLQFRFEAFNIFNHPNFAFTTLSGYLSYPQFFGTAQNMLNRASGGTTGQGENPLYSIGGPRSMQFALKLQF